MNCPNCHANLKVVSGRLVRYVPDVNVQMFPVESSFIDAVGYDPQSEILKVQMRGGTYLYAGVPMREFLYLLAAQSKGSYFNNYISGVYGFSRL